MKKIIVLFVLFFLQLTVSAQSSHLLASQKHTLMSSQILILGEIHDDIESKKRLPDLVKEIVLADSNYDCMSLELDQIHQASLDKSHTEHEYLQLVKEMYASVIGPAYLTIPTQRVNAAVASFFAEFKYWFQATEKMRQLNGQVFALDNFSNTATDYANITARNTFVAENIIDLMNNHTCKKIIVIIGAAHTRAEEGITINALLSKHGLNAGVILLQDLH